MTDLSSRIAGLTPEKRELLALLAQKQKPASAPPAPPAPPPAPIITEDQFHQVRVGELPAKEEVRRFYDSVNSQLNGAPYGEHSSFLNYGYVPNSNPQYAAVTLPEVCLNKNCIRLVLEVIGACPVQPHWSVLDVGCGRGGTITVWRRYFQVKRAVGLDLSPQAIHFCRQTHRFPETFFEEGDAENLPFADQEFEAVTNIESSHTYGDIQAFYRQVYRVLRPGGYFLYTDLLPLEKWESSQRFLQDLGFQLEVQQDITSNVLLSCDEVAQTHARAFTAENDENIMKNFLALPNSPIYHDLKNGVTRYALFRWKKAAASDSTT